MSQVIRVKAVKADVLDRYYTLICRFIRNNRKENVTQYNRARAIKKQIQGMVEYNKLYLQKGLNPVMFIERK